MERIRNRQSGVICHPTSFPGPHGIGDFGEAAFRYVDWLARGRQTLWQVLPLGPTGLGNSPYASPSAFAGNELLISLPWLVGDGLLDPAHLDDAPPFPRHMSIMKRYAHSNSHFCVKHSITFAGARRRNIASPLTCSAASRQPGWTTTPPSWR